MNSHSANSGSIGQLSQGSVHYKVVDSYPYRSVRIWAKIYLNLHYFAGRCVTPVLSPRALLLVQWRDNRERIDKSEVDQ